MQSQSMAKDNKYEARAWSTEEMRKECNSWTLAGDVGLLMFLQQFSQNMISKTHEMEKAVDELVYESKMTSTKVQNIINGFHMLSNTQFVETRVYDEEVQDSTPSVEKQEELKTKEQREAELIPKIALALNLGLKVIDEAFDKVEIQHESDSEDEEANFVTTPLLEPKDPYIHRPLPFIIGSDAFNGDDNIGLGEMLHEGDARLGKESSDDIESDVSFESESEDYEDNIAETWNATQEKVEKAKRISKSSASSEEESSDLFAVDKRNGHESASSFSSEENLVQPGSDNKRTEEQNVHNVAGFKDELAAALGGNIKAQKPSTIKEVKEKKKSLSKRGSTSTIVPPMDEDYEDDDDDSPFSKGRGLFSGGGKLIKDEEEEGDLFGSSYPSKSSRSSSQSHAFDKGGDDLFGRSDESEPAKSVSVEPAQQAKKPKPLPVKKTQGSFLDEEDDDDLFSSLVKKDAKLEKKPSVLFEDEDDDDLFSTGRSSVASSSTAESKKLPPGAQSLFGGLSGEIGLAIKSHRQRSSDSESEVTAGDDATSSHSSLSSKQNSIDKEIPSKAKTTTTPSLDLFSEEPEDDLFGISTKSRSTTNTSSSSSSSNAKKQLLDGSFSASMEDAKTELQQNEIPTPSSASKNAPATSEALFGEEADEDTADELFSSLKTAQKKKSQPVSLFKDDIFSPQKKPTDAQSNAAKGPEGATQRKATKISLFDSDDDTEDDLFSAAVSKKTDTSSLKSSKSSEKVDIFSPMSDNSVESLNPTEPVTRKKSNSVFEDDDLLFGGPANESPNVDLFAPSVSPKKPVGGVSIFGGVDLFAGELGKKKLEQKEIEDSVSEESAQVTKADPFPKIIKDSKELSVSFDEPVDVSNTLASTNRGRAKIQTKRRLPSRKGRQTRQAAVTEPVEPQPVDTKPAEEPVIDVDDELQLPAVTSLQAESPLEDTLKVPAQRNANSFTSPSTEEDDLFAVLEPTPPIFEAKPRKVGKSAAEDLFGSKDDPLNLDDDIFAPIHSVKDEIDNIPSVSRADTKVTSDDIFADISKPISSGIDEKSVGTPDKQIENGEDIFETSILSSMAAGSNDDNLFGDDSEDIFADLPSATRRDSWKMKKSDSLFGDEIDDDIFGTSSTKISAVQPDKKEAPRKTTSKTSAPRVETDIFDDPLLKPDDFD